MSLLQNLKNTSQNLLQKSRQKLISLLTNKPNSVESVDDLEQQIEYLNNNQALDIHIAKMLKGVLSIRNLRARDLMIPRAHIDYFEADDSLSEVLDSVLEYGHSRYPILDDNNEDQSLGLLFTKDLLRILINQDIEQTSLLEISKPIKIIPETKHVTTLLQEFQNSHTHLALVVNEFGEISGLITIEDILEEIVGDISDEFDKDDKFIQQVSKTSFDVLARTPIYLFNEAFNVDLSDSEFDTIGGYVFGLLGHMPVRNESIELVEGKLIARITQVNDRQILKLRIRAIQDFSVELNNKIRNLVVDESAQEAKVISEALSPENGADCTDETAQAQASEQTVEQANVANQEVASQAPSSSVAASATANATATPEADNLSANATSPASKVGNATVATTVATTSTSNSTSTNTNELSDTSQVSQSQLKQEQEQQKQFEQSQEQTASDSNPVQVSQIENGTATTQAPTKAQVTNSTSPTKTEESK
ncbi:hypothetical protein CKF54_01140 [Psittacicella hinzii]|uniref:Magnesium and cobalt efflux protein CorC n=1 Tax=Psittacicella hinzii TaxID=2028575 RepID=A0A3A1YA96_9GAMM|nr:CBS domain-containing protein [Psittacicella hinzii]RIY34256.1 hypothetical protein CKF54_01140 [Psittacicella hinzii]